MASIEQEAALLPVSQPGPAEVLSAAVIAAQARDWMRAVSYVDPAALQEFRDVAISLNRVFGNAGGVSTRIPVSPRDPKVLASPSDGVRSPLEILMGVPGIEALEVLSPPDFVASLLRRADSSATADGNLPAPYPLIIESQEVVEDSLALIRFHLGGAGQSEVHLRRTSEGWCLLGDSIIYFFVLAGR